MSECFEVNFRHTLLVNKYEGLEIKIRYLNEFVVRGERNFFWTCNMLNGACGEVRAVPALLSRLLTAMVCLSLSFLL